MRRNGLVLLVAGSLGLAARPAAAETTFCTRVATVPATIAAAGNWCLQGNLSTAAAVVSGAAITINADNVTLDLNGFTLSPLATAPTLTLVGVSAAGRRNVIVKNGTIRGFYKGVSITGAGSGHLVEGILSDANTFAGIWVEGAGASVRNSRILNTTGTTAPANAPHSDCFGIRVSGAGSRVSNNDVTATVGMGTGQGQAIYLDTADGAVVENNRIANAAAGSSTGIHLNAGADVLVVGNDVSLVGSGVVFGGASGKYQDNLTSGVTTPYTGGIDAGNNQ